MRNLPAVDMAGNEHVQDPGYRIAALNTPIGDDG
jgi:hypothetical protein